MRKICIFGGYSNTNMGDVVLQKSASDILRERCKHDLEFTYIDAQNTEITPQLIKKINKNFDLLFLGGGGFIFHNASNPSSSGWQFKIKQKHIKKIKIPIACYGLGYNKFPHSPEYPEYMWDNLAEFFEKAEVVSVRNYGTLNALRENHIYTSDISVVPDSAMFLKSFKYKHECLKTKKLKIGVNWATDREEQRFESELDSTLAMETFFGALNEVAENHNARIYLIDHLRREDRNKGTKDKLHRIAKQMLGKNVRIMFNEASNLFPPSYFTADFFTDIYRQMDFTFGMRGHANIIPFGQNTPPIGLGAHNKVKWFLETINMSDFLIDLNSSKEEIEDDVISLSNHYVENLNKIEANMYDEFKILKRIKDKEVDKIIELL